MDEVFSANCSLEQKFNLIEEHIRNFKNYSDWFEATGNLKLSEENLNTAMIKIEEYRAEIQLTKKDKNKLKELKGNVFNSFAIVYMNVGNLLKAEEYYLKSLKIKQNPFWEAMILNNLGLLYNDMGKIYQNIFRENNSDVANLYNNLGNLYNDVKDNDYTPLVQTILETKESLNTWFSQYWSF